MENLNTPFVKFIEALKGVFSHFFQSIQKGLMVFAPLSSKLIPTFHPITFLYKCPFFTQFK